MRGIHPKNKGQSPTVTGESATVSESATQQIAIRCKLFQSQRSSLHIAEKRSSGGPLASEESPPAGTVSRASHTSMPAFGRLIVF